MVVGGGPAGLAAAVAAAGIGLSVVVLERRRGTPDKACGEGLLPPAVRALGALGALSRVDPDARAPVAALRYVQEDGTFAEARLPGAALGVRRPALVEALASRAAEAGVEVRAGCTARGFRRIPAGISVETDAGDVRGRILVAADGLASPLRRAAGLDRPVRGSRRFGMRRHFRVEPWGPRVEVHFAAGIEAYVTPVGPRRVGVAFLWEDGAVAPATFDAFLARFPALSERLAGAAPDSPILGAGPLARGVRAPVADGVALVGDAAGYLDALTGEGLCLAFDDALCLSRVLPGALSRGATAAALAPYARDRRARFRRYASVTSAVLSVARRPPLRRAAIRWLSAHPRTFEAMVAWALGGDLSPSPVGVPASDP
ncbi:NAD(P)/FAD-dependent oxidoreductase [Myxococcota bacterium]|nr:NAD(P)/FAD-dependent oxidoreductase [Myxococcota bacterium]